MSKIFNLFIFLFFSGLTLGSDRLICTDEIFPLLRNEDYLKFGYIEASEYIILCQKIIGCLWGSNDFFAMTPMQQKLLTYLISN